VDDGADARRLRAAVVAAALVHAAVLTLTLPALEPRAAAPREVRPVFVVRTPVFRRPPVTPEVPVEAPVRRVPVPDPTPDDPEPIRPLTVEEVVLPIPAGDFIPIPDGPPPAAVDPGPYVVGGAVSAPVKLVAPPPLYPELARRARREGLVVVQAVIDREGRVTRLRAVKEEPLGLTEAALAAVREWRFAPGRLNGEPVDVLYSLTVNFRLQ
jgi:protein TonB